MTIEVLLVEDDRNISESLSSYLRAEGYQVTSARTLLSARENLVKNPSILILDWMLPDGQGLDFLKELRSQKYTMPVILLTARNDLVDKVLGLESGADDYITKPFEPRELIARMRVRLRETPKTQTAQALHFSGIELNSSTRLAKFKGRNLDLTKLEFDLLHLLMNQPGRVFTREEILNKVWGFENFPTTRTVDNHIVQLRQKIETEMFETLRGVGYRIVATKE